MSGTLPEIEDFLQQAGLAFEVWTCDPELADTAIFCEHYGVALEHSANAILARSKIGDRKSEVAAIFETIAPIPLNAVTLLSPDSSITLTVSVNSSQPG
jgi:hypothetical protein